MVIPKRLILDKIKQLRTAFENYPLNFKGIFIESLFK